VVGGFSFYDRAEIKDLISYLKVIQNPDDSISLLRVINTPARGIGKTTMELIESVALETGLSLWGAIGEVLKRQLLPQRALAALKSFRDLIEDGRAMMAGTFVERLQETAQPGIDAQTQVDQLAEQPLATALDESTGFNPMSFDFGPDETSFDFGAEGTSDDSRPRAESQPENESAESREAVEGFRAPGSSANVAEILKFLIDRTGYIKQLEEEDTPEAYSRIENLRELVNAAMDSKDRGETLDEFLDHAALVSDADQYDERAQITLMTLHAAKGLEFPLVVLAGLEEGLFPHSRTMLQPDDIEEERRLCYVGMTRAMDTLILSRAVYRRRYGSDLPEASVPSRFLEEVPLALVEEIGGARPRSSESSRGFDRTSERNAWGRSTDRGFPFRDYASRNYPEGEAHYSYEDEDQSASHDTLSKRTAANRQRPTPPSTPKYNSIDNIAEFFASRGKKFTRPQVPVEQATGRRGFKPGQRVRHPKYGEGMVYQREGEGDEAKITVQFPRFGLKKLVEKYAQLEKA